MPQRHIPPSPAFPETLPFRNTFLRVFRYVMDNDYAELHDPAEMDRDALREQLDHAISTTLDALGIDAPAGDSLEWLGTLHDYVNDAHPDIAEALDATTE
jgi:hypothetical protein